MAKHIVKILLTVLMLTLVWGCASSPSKHGPPEWVTQKDSVYPPEQFLAETGEGDSLSQARSAAAAAVARIFENRITVERSIRTRYSEITSGESLDLISQTDLDQNIGESTNQSLTNLKFGDSWADSAGRVYTVAYMNRAETGTLYRLRIMDNDKRAAELVDRAAAQNDPLRSYAFLDAALVFTQANQVLREQLEIISLPMARSVNYTYSPEEIRRERSRQASALSLRIEVSGDSGDLVRTQLSDWATERGFSVSDLGDMFLSGVVSMAPVDLDNGYKNLGWEINIALMDSFGYPAVSLSHQNRSSGISRSAAESRAYNDISDVIHRDFDQDFSDFINSFLEK